MQSKDVTESHEIIAGELAPEAVERLRLLQYLTQAPDRATYLERQRAVAKQLGMTVRNVQRLAREWQRSGLAGIVRHTRSDRGDHRLPDEWQAYILKTYRQGNRGGRQMSRAQVAVRVAARAAEIGESTYPSRATVYRVLQSEIDQQAQRQRKRSLGWQGEQLTLKTREGLEITIDHSNQVWQCDHTKLDIFVIDQAGVLLGRPWLTTVIDTYSRCIMGIYLGLESRSCEIVCLALRHAILPKQYPHVYELSQSWDSYGIPQYLYTDGGKEVNSQHLEQVASELNIVLCQRRYPSEGGIVERPFGTLNSELLSSLPGYTGRNVKQRPKSAEVNASLTLEQLDRLLVRYIVERYNQSLDFRCKTQTRIGLWDAGRIAQLPLLGERDLDICLMRRSRRVVYRGGYIQFVNLSYRGEHLDAYTGEWVVLRYHPRDITSVMIYQEKHSKDQFLTRAHAVGWETEALSLADAQTMSRRLRQAGRSVSNQSLLDEVRLRDVEVSQHQRRQRRAKSQPTTLEREPTHSAPQAPPEPNKTTTEAEGDDYPAVIAPKVRVHDYEELKQNYGW